jgi:hypothetical protein
VSRLIFHSRILTIGTLALSACMGGSFSNIQVCSDPDEVDTVLSADEASSSGVTPAEALADMSELFVGQFVVTESVASADLPSTFAATMRFSNVEGRDLIGIDVVEGDCSRFLQVYVGLVIESEVAGFGTVIEGYAVQSAADSWPAAFLSSSRQNSVVFEDERSSEPVFLLLEEYWEGDGVWRWVMSEGVEALDNGSRPFASGTWSIVGR